MFQLQQQFSNIIETTQLTNDQMPEFHYRRECLKCPPPAPTFNTRLQSLNLRSLSRFVDRSLWQVALDNLMHFLDLGDCFRFFYICT